MSAIRGWATYETARAIGGMRGVVAVVSGRDAIVTVAGSNDIFADNRKDYEITAREIDPSASVNMRPVTDREQRIIELVDWAEWPALNPTRVGV